jgi:hypothetical protein
MFAGFITIIKSASRGEYDFTAILHNHIKQFLGSGSIEIVDDNKRVGFQFPQKAVMPFEACIVAVKRVIVR